MDAKPQRPLRAIRVHGDENAVVGTLGPKTIHSRNKSSPALSTMAAAGAAKLGAKRTAFGDVSNVANNRPSRDDWAIPSKIGYEVSGKAIHILEDTKTAALSRPAQRPISLSGLKGLLHVSGTSATSNLKSVPSEIHNPPQRDVRKAVAKRISAIVKDIAPPVPEHQVPNVHKPLSTKASVPLVHQDHSSRPYPIEPGNLQKPQIVSSHVVSSHERIEQHHEPSVDRSLPEESAVRHSDVVYIDENGMIQVCNYPDETNHHDSAYDDSNHGVHLLEEAKSEVQCQSGHFLDTPLDEPQQPDAARKSMLPPVSEPEEYWDDEEYDDHYEEDGYVTGRSYRSRDNTTSGLTTILVPKITGKAKKELAAAKALVEGTRTVEEIDDEAWDMSMVSEYGEEIFQYMRELEIKMLPNPHYMDNQTEIQWSMRSVLMDWLVQVHHRFGLLPETLFLCVNYIDRFLSCKIVSLGKLQLVGATAIFVAAKYEEINCPSVAEIVFMVDSGYTIDEILKAERFMLSMLQFELGYPGPMSFLRRISKADDYDLETRTLAKYFLEITIMDERFLGCPPSFTAAGAHCLSRMMLRKGNWSPAHVYYSGYTYSQLLSLIHLMVECCVSPQRHHSAIFEKYSDRRYKRASSFVEKEMRHGFQVVDIATNSAATLIGFYEH